MKVVTAAEMRALEARADELGLPSPLLMENAGAAIAQVALDEWRARPGRVLVLCGPGNNGGDGLVAARRLATWGAPVVAYLWNRPAEDTQRDLAALAGVRLFRQQYDPELTTLRRELLASALVLDALLGTGVSRPIGGVLLDLIRAAREELGERRVVAVDLPSGVNADSGAVDPATIPAHVTVTLGLPKVGLLTFPAAGVVGELTVADIGIPADAQRGLHTEALEPAAVATLLPQRPLDGHKGTFGRALVVAGCASYLGAPRLAALGAARAGAGLVGLGIPRSIQSVIASQAVEPTFVPLSDEGGFLGPQHAGTLTGEAERSESVLVGPGLGQHADTIGLVRDLLSRHFHGLTRRAGEPLPIVVDADGLNALADWPDWHERIGPGHVLTPHPGELRRLAGSSAAEPPSRVDQARDLATAWGQVLVLKGAYTVVAAPDGEVAICPLATPSLASGGTGDVLAGVIAGLLAQGAHPYDAARAGVYVHALAGLRLAARLGAAGGLASELLPLIPEQLDHLRRFRDTPTPLRRLGTIPAL
ncbi:MAG: NAD(P)H-hydrate dehydratase [Chloroflexi bacterium]|nr:NAD(P)H-hydrate dehydratase [Chloroflexota bacterium]